MQALQRDVEVRHDELARGQARLDLGAEEPVVAADMTLELGKGMLLAGPGRGAGVPLTPRPPAHQLDGTYAQPR